MPSDVDAHASRSHHSTRYTGERGDDYFRWQAQIGSLGARRNREKFENHVTRSDVVLDFGCGGGYLLAGLPVKERLGVEINEHARGVAAANGIQVVRDTSEIRPGSVDVVISNHALEHVRDPFGELRKLHAVLRSGGHLVLWLPLNDWRGDRKSAADRNGHLFTWTTLTLTNLLEEAGFGVASCEVVTDAWSLRTARLEDVLPSPVRRELRRLQAIVRRRRQLYALAVKEISA
jgi:SAM-dependent methyltransferase